MDRGCLIYTRRVKPFPRLETLPPYVLAEVDAKKRAALARGEEVFDFGVGNPDLPPPALATEALIEAIRQPGNHRYMPSHGLEAVRDAIADWYRRRYGVTVDAGTEAVATLGSKEGLGHLFYAVLGAGQAVLVPDPCYPIHRVGVMFAGGQVVPVPTGPDRDPLVEYEAARRSSPSPPAYAIVNFPHNPTTATVDATFYPKILEWAEKHDIVLISDIAYADLSFEGDKSPSMLAVPGASARAVEFFTVSKSYSLPGWRVGFCVGNPKLIGALKTIKTYLDYGIYGPLQLAAARMLGPAGDEAARQARETYRARRDTLCQGLGLAGWVVEPPKATMFVWAPLPERARSLGAANFAARLFDATRVAVSPGTGFGPGGEGAVRFALVEDVSRLPAATQKIGEFLKSL